MGSLRNKTGPMVFNLADNSRIMAFRIHTNHITALITKIKKTYHEIAGMSGQPFSYSFMDKDFNNLYQSEQRTGKIFIYFTFFAIFIACLGLFGLITYAAEQRTKEIGVRKVLGTSVFNIVSLLSKDFLKLVIMAIVIAVPIAWLAMNKWLQNFAYRINISWWIFVAAGVLVILIALLPVSWQAVRAARANPVESLRTE